MSFRISPGVFPALFLLPTGDVMKFKKIRKVWIITKMVFMILTIFFALFIPSMYCNFKLLEIITTSHTYTHEGVIVFILISFGLLYISLAIAGHIMFFYDDKIYKWSEKFKTIQ